MRPGWKSGTEHLAVSPFSWSESGSGLNPSIETGKSGTLLKCSQSRISTGVLFGTIFAFGARKFCSGLERYILAGTGYGIAIWLLNFYGILSWLQPLLYGRAFILEEIPIAVAVLTHICYGLTVAFVTYVLQRDVSKN